MAITTEALRHREGCEAYPGTSPWLRVSVVLKGWTLGLDKVFDLLHELTRRHVLGLLFPAGAHVHFARLGFLISDDQQERHFLQRVLPDLGIHLFIARIHLDPHPNRAQLRRDPVGIFLVAFADGNQRRLHRRQPHRERTRVVLDEYSEKSLDRTPERPVHNHWTMPLAVFANVFQLETLGKIEVELYGGKLPRTSDRVHQLHVNLRTIENRLARHRLVLHIAPLQCL